jgi:hypothetical protein
MGCGMSTEEKEGKARNEEIENQLKRDRMQQRNEIKMLLLGTLQLRTLTSFGDSGKAGSDNRIQELVNPESRPF